MSRGLESLKELFVNTFMIQPRSLIPVLIQKSLIQIVAIQDSCLVQVLSACLKLTGNKQEIPLDIHSLFVTFLSSIAFDHTVLLDLFISPETKFDSFLVDYLDLLEKTGMPNLISACETRDSAIFYSIDTTLVNVWHKSTLQSPHSKLDAVSEDYCSACKVPKFSSPSENSKDYPTIVLNSEVQEEEKAKEEEVEVRKGDAVVDDQEEDFEEYSSISSSVLDLLFRLSQSLSKFSRPQLLPASKSTMAHHVHSKITTILDEWTE